MHFFDLFTSLSLPFPRLLAYEDKSAYALSAFSFALGPDVEPVTFLQKTPDNFRSLGTSIDLLGINLAG
ncbi:hypothetical protein V6N11_065389 [Hibiscus sabdariffa]|uniref:Uncharacterized protein n=1 Tax=Hibiscus sabdariffa TaxID=183260 RepID=A0ABR1ZEE7_9ROSI